MRWESEKWRKLYRRVDAAWARLPVLARGLGSELLKYADDDGRIPVREDEQTGEAVCCLMGARRAEWKAIEACVQALLDDGYIVREAGAILIRNFAKAQARSTGAERQARLRERRRENSSADGDDVPEPHGGVTGEHPRNVTVGVTSNGTRDATGNATVAPSSPDEVTDRALPLSGISSDSSFLNSKNPSDTASARDSKGDAKMNGQAALWAEETQRPKRRGVETPIPDGWAPSTTHFQKGRELGLSEEDVRQEASKFRSDALAKDKRFVRWDQAFNTWLTNAAQYRKRDDARRIAARPQQTTAREGSIAEIDHG
jgi:hypothetical protein